MMDPSATLATSHRRSGRHSGRRGGRGWRLPGSACSMGSTPPWAGCSRRRLGLHRHKRSVVMPSLPPIALGHALAVAVFVTAALTLGSAIDARLFSRVPAASC
ncbi:hypothetical protein ACTMU2_25675 [Cupriavidus basilensis]